MGLELEFHIHLQSKSTEQLLLAKGTDSGVRQLLPLRNSIMSGHQPFDGNAPPFQSTLVAVDKDKSSGYAFRWAINHLDNPVVVLLHVRNKNNPHQGTNVFPPDDNDLVNIFIPLRGVCPRKAVQIKEAVLDDSDVARGILNFANKYYVHSIVIGASTKNSLSSFHKKFKGHDAPTTLTKTITRSAPDFSSVYVISKGKIMSARPALRAMANSVTPPRQPPPQELMHCESELVVRAPPATRGGKNEELERWSLERMNNGIRTAVRERPRISTSGMSVDNIDLSVLSQRSPISRDSLLDESDFSGSLAFASMDVTKSDLDFSITSDTPRTPTGSQSTREMEAEMKRLRLELKQTMEMYSSACKEAISAKNEANEISQWKLEEARKVEQARLAGQAALAMAEMEKAKAKAAMEAAEEARRMAEKEAQKRKNAEMKAKREADEKDRAVTALVQSDVRYRKYTIEEIETATEKFSPSMKLGEGGYGPVYKGKLDHTPVAIKILRPDAAQGRRQFNQEVEVLSCIRHPNMVLLLGACPEYGCLVYEYMDYGSLEDRFLRKNNSPPIPWWKRFQIAAEIATALLFLHQKKPEPLVHRDLKPANILIDRNYVSKISDVGLARLVPPSVADSVTQYHMTSAAGTFCYIDPEYQQTGMLTTKSDIYSLGIMLLQIITARSPMGIAHHVSRAMEKGRFSEMLDPVVTDWPVEEALAFANVALKCAELSKRDRPDLAKVVVPELNRLRDLEYTLTNNQVYSSNNKIPGYFGRPPTPTRNPHSKTSIRNQEVISKSDVQESIPSPKTEYYSFGD
ncbi:hypothetical protein L6164_024482 [Bauhinia variegata]|uniref:Uncharacterized protein n=1 Tax=Bauhinia variegata TaxID=167791 RepID=A0ACB9LZ26_BAUVA|nr:hypothetical protein L6164_024482 [Bauhinia variegata]